MESRASSGQSRMTFTEGTTGRMEHNHTLSSPCQNLSRVNTYRKRPAIGFNLSINTMMSLLSGKNGLFNPTHQASKGLEYPCSFFFARTMHGSLQNLEFPIIAAQAFQLP